MSMTIGRVAASAGVGVQTLRFYEREGLIDAPARSRSGYRTYDDDVVTRLKFIRRAQNLGFTLKEVRELIALHYQPGSDCGDIMQVAQAKLSDVQQKINDLERMRDTLQDLVASCKGGTAADCSVIQCFNAETRGFHAETQRETDTQRRGDCGQSLSSQRHSVSVSSASLR